MTILYKREYIYGACVAYIYHVQHIYLCRQFIGINKLRARASWLKFVPPPARWFLVLHRLFTCPQICAIC